MFDLLTPSELSNLSHKFSNAAHAAHNVTEALALAAGLFPITTEPEARIWDARRRWCDLAYDLSELAAECRSARAALAVRMAADVLPHDEGTSYCTSIPEKCPIHDA